MGSYCLCPLQSAPLPIPPPPYELAGVGCFLEFSLTPSNQQEYGGFEVGAPFGSLVRQFRRVTIRRTGIFLATLVVLSASGCAPQVDLEAERTALLGTDKEWAEAAATSDMERLLSFWTEDAVIYPAGAPAVVGKEAIREFIHRSRSLPGFSVSWEPTQAVVSDSGNIGYTLGTTEFTVNDAEGKPISNRGKYVLIWKKQADGSWECAVDIFNFNTSATGPRD